MSDIPKVGEEGWSMKPIYFRDDEPYPCKILEINNENGRTTVFVSYYSQQLARRCVSTVSRGDLVKVPVKQVSYQFMSVEEPWYVNCLACCLTEDETYNWKRVARYHNQKLFVQRTEVTGDKIEVFVERTL